MREFEYEYVCMYVRMFFLDVDSAFYSPPSQPNLSSLSSHESPTLIKESLDLKDPWAKDLTRAALI